MVFIKRRLFKVFFFEMILFILTRFQTLTVCSPALSSGADGKYSFLASVIQHNILNTRI